MDTSLSSEAVRGFQVHELRFAILRLNNSLNIYNDLIVFRKSVLMSRPQNFVLRYRIDEAVAISVYWGSSSEGN
jgi:hypothetical protein